VNLDLKPSTCPLKPTCHRDIGLLKLLRKYGTWYDGSAALLIEEILVMSKLVELNAHKDTEQSGRQI